VRSALLTAKEPAPLLFKDLPKACGFGVISVDDSIDDVQIINFVSHLKETLDELKGAYLQLKERIKMQIMKIFDLPGSFLEVRGALSAVSKNMLVAVTEPKIKAFCIRLMDDSLSESEWIESLGSFVCSKPPARWNDSDEDMFYYEFSLLGSRFRRIESICFKKNALGVQGTAVRISITQSDGAEIERVVSISKDDEILAAELEIKIDKLLEKNKRVGMAAVSRAFWKAMNEVKSDA